MKTCYGVSRHHSNELVANQFAINVPTIHALYFSGKGLRDISKYLKEAHIRSPSGKPKWTPRANENILSNNTYLNTIVSEDTFNRVRAEQAGRSITVTTEHGITRKATRYNSRNVENENRITSNFSFLRCGKPFLYIAHRPWQIQSNSRKILSVFLLLGFRSCILNNSLLEINCYVILNK